MFENKSSETTGVGMRYDTSIFVITVL